MRRRWLASLLLRLRQSNAGYQVGLIGFVSASSIARTLPYLASIHPRFLRRGLFVVGCSLASAPLRAWERLRHGRRISAVAIAEPPIFVIGHWRSGTTHLHNLMSQDPALGCVTMFQAMAPDCSLAAAWLKPLLASIMPLKRPMDNMVWPVDAPQEEEIPLAKLTPYSFYIRSLFPMQSADLFRRYVLLDGAPARVGREIRRKYLRILQVATLHAGGRRLVLKNPVNTARIRLLLGLFPDAKFIHAVRCPYEVFASTSHLHARVLPLTTLQDIPEKPSVPIILSIYEDMMRRFTEDRARIPAGNFAEVRFEDLERDPLGELRRVYDRLGLPGFAAAEPAFRAYVSSQRSYARNRLDLSPEDREAVTRRWAFAFSEFGYPTQAAARSPRIDAAAV